MAEKPFLPEFPDLPDKLIQIVGLAAYREWKKAMEEWIVENQVGMDHYTTNTLQNFFRDTVETNNFFPPKFGTVGLFDSPYNLALNGSNQTVQEQFGKLVLLERSLTNEVIQSGEEMFVAKGSALTGKAYLFTPPNDFWIPVIQKGIFPVRYPHFGTGLRGCVRTNFETRMLRRTDVVDDAKGITQIWSPGYDTYGGTHAWIYSPTEEDWSKEPIGTLDIGVNHFDVYNGNWFDLNVAGSTWKDAKALLGYEFTAFPVNNFDPFPGGDFTAIPQWQDV